MLHSIQTIQGFKIGASDGDIGTVEVAYFDDARWAIRYLVTDTGGWLSGRKVLISPRSIQSIDWPNEILRTALTRDQVEKSPSIDTHEPVERQHEMEYSKYYGHSSYWDGPYLWGMGVVPIMTPIGELVPPHPYPDAENRAVGDPHLRSSGEVLSYYVGASDGDIGHVEDFLFDDETWAIRYLVIDTSNWWAGKRVLVSPAWVERIDWSERKVFASMTRSAIEASPEYDPSHPPGRDYEDALHRHYRKPTYWTTHDEPRTPLSES